MTGKRFHQIALLDLLFGRRGERIVFAKLMIDSAFAWNVNKN